MAIVFVKAVGAYFNKHPRGAMPGYGFFSDYLEPFLEYEFTRYEIDVMLRRNQTRAEVERELAVKEGQLYNLCVKMIGPQEETE